MTGMRARSFPLPRVDLITALLVAAATGGVVLLQRVVIFGAFEEPDENQFAQVMALWAVISVLVGRIQHRSMAGAAEPSAHLSVHDQKLWNVELVSLTTGCLVGIAAWVTPHTLLSLSLSSLCYATSLPVLLGLIGRAYGFGSATVAQTASLLVAGIQLVAASILILFTSAALAQVIAMLAMSTVAGTSVLRLWWRHQPPINWQIVLTPLRHLFLGSAALGSSWAACQADIFALALVTPESQLSESGAAIYLGKTGLYVTLPIIPVLAKQSHSGRLLKRWKLVLATCLGAVGAATAVMFGLAVLGTLPESLTHSESHILTLIALTQAPAVMILIFSYSNAMNRKVRMAATLGPLVSLSATMTIFRLLGDDPATCLTINGLSLALLAVFLARSAS